MVKIQPYEESDWKAIWRIIEPVFRAGESYSFSLEISEEEAHRVWVEMPETTYVALDHNSFILGTY